VKAVEIVGGKYECSRWRFSSYSRIWCGGSTGIM